MSSALLSSLFSATVQLVVGLRLLFLARASKELPELLLGANLFILGFLKYSRPVGLHLFDLSVVEVRIWTDFLYSISHLLFYITWWRVFRPRSRWAKSVCIGIGLLLIASFVVQGTLGWNTSSGGWTTWFGRLRIWVAAGSFAWGAIECFTHAYRLRRQMTLGLAAPSVACRFVLWGFTQVTTFVLVLMIYCKINFGLIGDTTLYIIWPVINFINGICWWMSFLTPAWVKRRLDRGYVPAFNG